MKSSPEWYNDWFSFSFYVNVCVKMTMQTGVQVSMFVEMIPCFASA